MRTARFAFKSKLTVTGDEVFTITINRQCSNTLDKTGRVEMPLKSSTERDLLYLLALLLGTGTVKDMPKLIKQDF